jgi:hypothetical protein
MRTSLGTVLGACGALIAAGCSHHNGKSTTEEIRGQAPGAEADTQGGMAPANSDAECPMQVPGTSVRTEETASGPALAFTTTGNVEELRMRVRRMAAANNRATQQEAMTEHNAARDAHETPDFPGSPATSSRTDKAAVPSNLSPDSHAAPAGSTTTQSDLMGQLDRANRASDVTASGAASPPVQARSENTESGARLVFAVQDASQLERVRDRVQTSAQTLASGRCPASTMNVPSAQGTNAPQHARPPAGGGGAY